MHLNFQSRAWRLMAFFAAGELLSHTATAFKVLWCFLSPLQWLGSLALVMTGDYDTIEALLQKLTFSGHGLASVLVVAIEAAILGPMLVTSFLLVLRHAQKTSRLGGLLFQLTFVPIWSILMLYGPLVQHSPAFASLASGLENMTGDIRRGSGFGILLLSLVIPMLALLGTKALELVLRPEHSYLDSSN